VQSPFTLHQTLIAAIEAEAENARHGKPSRIAAKMNALIEPTIIEALYRASQAGVPVDLIVRGMCSLKPGVPGLSETIRVRSIVGRFLEHSRAFYFLAAGKHRLLCGSADWMQRNFFGRVEVCFPIETAPLRERVVDEAITSYLDDNSQAWELQADGSYRRLEPGGADVRRAQEMLLRRLANVPT